MSLQVVHRKSDSIKLLEYDPWLASYETDLRMRKNRFFETLRHLISEHGSLKNFASGHVFFGIHRTSEGFVYREWAPNASQLFLIGDFNNWNRGSHPMQRLANGAWEITLPFAEYEKTFTHGSLVKVHVVANGIGRDRIPLYAQRVVQYLGGTEFAAQLWFPEAPFVWSDNDFTVARNNSLYIYECHVGMAQEKEGVGTYLEFADNILPRIKNMGYTAIQIMAIQEHPYYGSFGYHVSNFFAASSRFGTPEELKYLINKAHAMGIVVLLDIVHSHAVKNINEGINEFDGTSYQFFHAGSKGDHSAWDSKLFDYSSMGVKHFLLSNIRFWLEEYHFDGFRFDGVTSMLYHHHGLGHAFDNYGKYFSMDTDVDAVLYLQLVNALAREVCPHSITIAEDMSAMPGMCVPIHEGGIGFDYRLSMGIPDFWVKTLRNKRDEDWNLFEMWYELTTRRPHERNVGYAESHDQALVGDKTIAFWLMDASMYWFMRADNKNIVIDRGVALHKMIRLISSTLGGESYLNFMGNEFGHPEWIDFPREGNGWSYKYARRQWSLVDNPELKFKYLGNFDAKMLALVKQHDVLNTTDLQQLWICNDRKILIYRKAGLIFVFNFHPSHSVTDFEVGCFESGNYKIVLDSDSPDFGGHARLDSEVVYATTKRENAFPANLLHLYIPCRSAFVLAKQ